ncbi:hypothetical protein P3X46_021895 [Hevea brasiliensis]|uniref:TF-B3 domain-containing protein n=1 Tax=Hevea brasiliensis TaxID=3981 RepID=A0ABQ9LKZ9_HEVBR|nr:B3 domain-containing protein At2g33720-like [Hevea brasiliensis]KAJ9167229.1 hypothetical protein P3X46_021895 [Hevea brasiliensis]
MEKQPLDFCGSFDISGAQEANKDQLLSAKLCDKKRKYQHNLESEENSGVSTDLTLSCDFPSKIKRPRISKISSSAEIKKSIPSVVVVSTELKLFDETWIGYASATAKRREPDDDVSKESSNSELKTLARNTKNEIICNSVEERKKRLKHPVWTKLALSDPWKIKKRLTGSDLGNHCRLLVGSVWVKNHILPFMSNETVEEIRRDGARVPFWDCDTNTEQHLILKHWHTAKSYVFINGWLNHFVKRRKLVEGDLIGIYWDPSEDIFKFSVLERASDVYP